MDKKKLHQEFEITELFLVKCGNEYKRTFIGQIHRATDCHGSTLFFGKATVDEGYIWSMSSDDEDSLRKNLDDICLLKLDNGLHSRPGIR